MITNLLDNANKFTTKGEITPGYLVLNRIAEFFVKENTGIEISETNQKIIIKRS